MKHFYFLLILILAAGCSKGAARVAVEGTVMFQGQPVADASVSIRPEAGPDAGAKTDANGKFSIPKNAGPMPGNVQVMVEKFTESEEKGGDGRLSTVFKPVLPEGVQGKLIPFTIKSGKNTLEIKLD
jgi:hypothetical protein